MKIAHEKNGEFKINPKTEEAIRIYKYMEKENSVSSVKMDDGSIYHRIESV